MLLFVCATGCHSWTRRCEDFQEALKLEPANDSVKQELKKVQEALKAAPSVPKQVSSTRSVQRRSVSNSVYYAAKAHRRPCSAKNCCNSSQTEASTNYDRRARAGTCRKYLQRCAKSGFGSPHTSFLTTAHSNCNTTL